MLPPLISLIFLACFWIAGSLALQLLADNFERIRTALSGRGGTCSTALPGTLSF